MFEKAELLYLYVETPLHAGSGTSVGIVDLPIQRERGTNYPLVQASGVKGKLRAEACAKLELQEDNQRNDKITTIFGPKGEDANLHAGAIAPSDAKLLLFPVRSLVGVFAWATSRHILARFLRDWQAANPSQPPPFSLNPANVPDDKEKAWTVNGTSLCAGAKVVLEEFAFPHQQYAEVGIIANWLADNAIPQGTDYDYFRAKLRTNFVILPEDAFRDFTQFSTEVITRIKINQATKTVETGALWTEEHLPSDTLLYSVLHATRPRNGSELFNDDTGQSSAQKILTTISGLGLDRIQLGGDETVGRGLVKLRFGGVA